MLFPYQADVAMYRWPIGNWLIIAVTVILSVTWFATGVDKATVERMLLNKESFSATQLVTYQFYHGGLLHLLGNMWYLFVFGNAVNARIGHALYPIAYLLCGVVSGLVWMMLGGGSMLIGASSVMGVLGLFLVYYPRNDVGVVFCLGWWYVRRFSMSAWILIVIYFILDFIGVLSGGGAVAHVAHLGGLVFGVFIGVLLLVTRVVPPDENETSLLEVLRIQRR